MENTIPNFRYEFGAKIRNGFHRNHFIISDENFNTKEKEWITKHNEIDVYRCSYAYETKDIESCKIISDLYLDFDGDISSEENYKKLILQIRLCYQLLKNYLFLEDKEIHIYFSGAKGFHIIIPHKVLGIEKKETLNVDFKTFAQWLKKQSGASIIDLGIYDRKRLLRITNTINSKTGLYKVPISIEDLYNFSLQDILNYAKEKHTEKDIILEKNNKASNAYKKITKPTIKVKTKEGFIIPLEPKELLPCAVELLKNGAKQGTRNNSCVVLASSLLQSGESREEAYKILEEWNQLNDPPLNEQELKVTFNSAYMMLQSGKRYGCNTYKDLNYCIGNKCKLFGEKDVGRTR